MTSSLAFGAALGMLLSAVSISQNIRRGDPHLVSTFPDLIGMVLFAVTIYIVTRRQSGRLARQELLWFGLRQVFVGGMVFATVLTLFSLGWFRGGSIAYVMFLIALGSTMAIGGSAVLLAARPAQGPDSVRT